MIVKMQIDDDEQTICDCTNITSTSQSTDQNYIDDITLYIAKKRRNNLKKKRFITTEILP